MVLVEEVEIDGGSLSLSVCVFFCFAYCWSSAVRLALRVLWSYALELSSGGRRWITHYRDLSM